jgi:hypothetical protein
VNSPSSLLAPRSSHTPSRHDNPFATCWTRPGALPYCFPNGQSAGQLVERLAALHWQGAIIGPHGSGKSALVQALKPALKAAGCELQEFTLRPPQPTSVQLSMPQYPTAALRQHSHRRLLVIIDGYDQLGWWRRWRLTRFCRRAGCGLLVTAHSPLRIPALIHLRPSRALVEQLVAQLAARTCTPIILADVAASHACYGSNVREIFFDLYDRHERRRRAGRTPAA